MKEQLEKQLKEQLVNFLTNNNFYGYMNKDDYDSFFCMTFVVHDQVITCEAGSDSIEYFFGAIQDENFLNLSKIFAQGQTLTITEISDQFIDFSDCKGFDYEEAKENLEHFLSQPHIKEATTKNILSDNFKKENKNKKLKL